MRLISNSIELLSIHIPKTGGSSFQKTLQALYGEDAFQRLDFTVRERDGRPRMLATNRTSQALLDQLHHRGELPAATRVLHGHFHYEDFARFFEVPATCQVVTWLRDPVQRIVSNYHYLLSQFDDQVQHTPLSRQLFKRLVKSLPEFASHPRDTNLYADYLRGRELADYDFVGIIEAYGEELVRLGHVLGKADLPQFEVNKARGKAPALDSAQETALAALNQGNLAVYSRALALKAACDGAA